MWLMTVNNARFRFHVAALTGRRTLTATATMINDNRLF